MTTTGTTTTEARVARFFGLTGEHWMRHANPISVWSRFSIVPLLTVAVWSRVWIGWYCLLPIAASVAWMMLNPLLFPKPRSTRNWASKGVLGERVWSERNTVTVPAQFRSPVPNLANLYSTAGLLLLAYGLTVLSLLPTVAGVVIVSGGKLWYIDRMVLLFDDMKARHAEYATWDY